VGNKQFQGSTIRAIIGERRFHAKVEPFCCRKLRVPRLAAVPVGLNVKGCPERFREGLNRRATMRTLRIAMMALGSCTVLLGLTVAPATDSVASTSGNSPSTQVTFQAPIAAGPSRSECLTPNFDDTGLAALQTAITSFDSLTNSNVTCVSAYLNSATTWADWESPWITNSSYGYTSWVAEEPQSRQLVLAVDLIPNDLEDISDPLGWEQSCAAGDFDSYATELGSNLVAAGLQNSVLRLGAEMNGTWETDFIGTTTQEQSLWATCFAMEVTALRQAAGENFLIDWDPNAGKGGYPFANFYPGNSYVDIVGLDLYDVDSNTPNTSETFSTLANEPFGLNSFEAFAAANGKPMSFPEWGLSNIPSGDDPGYVDGMGSTIANEDVAFEAYFEGAGTTSTTLPLSATTTPQSLDAYQQWFGTPSVSAATISGVVTALGSDVPGICVDAYLNGADIAASAVTAADGTYTISGLAPGSYGVSFLPCAGGNYATQWYNGTSGGTQTSPGVLVTVSASAPALGIDAMLSSGTNISGTVNAAQGGGALAGICVSAFPVGSTTSAVGAATSVSDGTYTVQGLLPGSYDVEFSAGSCGGNYVTQWYNDTPPGASSVTGAVPVAVAVGSSADSVNAAMPASTSISGTVTAVGGSDMANMCVWAYPVGGGPVVKATTALDGMYVISGLATGSYNVEFYTSPCGGRNYVTQWYNDTPTGASSMSGALPVAVSVASPATDINAAMALIDVITPSTNPPTDAVVGVATYLPSAIATSGDNVVITIDSASSGCSILSGVVSFTADGTCIIDFNDPSSGVSDAYASAVEVQQSFSIASSSGGGGGGGSGGSGGSGGGSGGSGSTSPPPPTSPPSGGSTPPVLALPLPREVTFAAGASVLSARADEVLRALAKKLQSGAVVVITGYAHHDATLAKERADSVAAYLEKTVGVRVLTKVVTTSNVNKVMVHTAKN
jgi:uncharacterized membrane protein YgcG